MLFCHVRPDTKSGSMPKSVVVVCGGGVAVERMFGKDGAFAAVGASDTATRRGSPDASYDCSMMASSIWSYITTELPRTTDLPLSSGVQAKPKRGPKLFLSRL